jgi:uncharacterized membrane protein
MFEPIYQFLDKIGYPHPIHPTEVHMPIGLVVSALVFFVIALLFKRQALSRTSRHCIILAFIWTFPTMLFGYMDWQHFYAGAWLFPIKMKIILACVLVVLLCVSVVAGRKLGAESKVLLVMYGLCFLTVVALGYFGGQMVYGDRSPHTSLQGYPVGQKIFKADCSGCHPQGGNIINPNLPLKSAPQLADFNTFLAFTRKPSRPDGSKGIMPPFPPSKISDQQERELYDYIVIVLQKAGTP